MEGAVRGVRRDCRRYRETHGYKNQEGNRLGIIMLDLITNNFGLLTRDEARGVVGRIGRVSINEKDDKDSIDTFRELTRTIEELIENLPSITIPSTIVGKTKFEGFKEICKLYKKQNLNKVFLLSCTMMNLIARHSGAKELSKVAGFMQNCLALYSIGDSLCSHISFNWDYADTMYIIANGDLPGGTGITMAQYREIGAKYEKANYEGITLTNSSIFVLANMVAKGNEQTWFSSADQKEHRIATGRTNVKDVARQWVKNDDNSESYELRYTFTDDALTAGKPSNAVFELMFDDVQLYIVQSVNSFADEENANVTQFEPNREIRYFWIPKAGVVLTTKEVNELNENIQQYLNMLFVNNIDTQRFMFTFDENGEIVEIVRPKAIPEHFVSNKIPDIINGIKILHDKKLSRSYALVGQAGTGKTIGAQQISNSFMDVCTFKITKTVIENEDIRKHMLEYIRAIKRCIIILDDMDRSNLSEKNDSVCAYLNFFDDINLAAKNDQVSYVFVATINDPAKINKVIMQRSGRIDEMIEIGYPDIDAMRYLFHYNDMENNADNLADFNDHSFDDALQEAIDTHITAADVKNIFTDMIIYGDPGQKVTPEAIHNAIARVKDRNEKAGRNYLD